MSDSVIIISDVAGIVENLCDQIDLNLTACIADYKATHIVRLKYYRLDYITDLILLNVMT